MKIVVFQQEVPPYRIPFFEKLGQSSDIDLTLVVATPVSKLNNCNIILIDSLKVSKFVLLRKIPSLASYDAIVFPFDLRWLQLYSMLLLHHDKLVLWGHGMGKNKSLAKFRSVLIKRSKGFIGYEKASNEFFLQQSISENKLRYVGNTVAVDNAEYSKKKREYFLYLGRLQERKKVDDVILAARKLLDRNVENVRIVIVGNGDIKSELEDVVSQNQLSDYVEFYPGTYSQEETKDYFASAIAYVSPGHVGLGVLHSFAFGVPVITYESEGHAPEVENITNKISGDIIEPGVDNLANTLEDYLVNGSRAEDKGKAAYDWFINNRTIDNMVANFSGAIKFFLR